MATGANLTYQTNATALQMANAIFGGGVAVTGASYSGPTNSKAIYSNGQLSPGVVPSTTGVILPTGNAADFTQANGDPNRSTSTSTNTTGGTAKAKTFSYMAKDNLRPADTAFVTIISVPCFVAGTRILIPVGVVARERLKAGDLVMTQADGPQPPRWIGRRAIPATGDHAPRVAKLASLFPDLNLATGQGYSHAARRTSRGVKAQVLFAGAQAA